MKVGIVLNNFYNETIGGGYSYYNSIISSIDQHDFTPDIEIKFISDSNKIKIFRRDVIFIGKKIPFYSSSFIFLLKVFNFLFNRIFNFSNLVERVKNYYVEKELKISGIDILYYPTPSECKLNIPYIATFWDLGHKSSFAFPELSMNGSYDLRSLNFNSIFSRAFAILAESISGKNDLIYYERINPKRIFVLPMTVGNVVNLNISKLEQEGILNKLKLRSKNYFFYPAQFWSHKNHFNLICAFREYLKRHNDTKLVFTGSDKGNLDYITECISDFDLTVSVIYLGFVTEEVLYTLYRNSIALVYPSLLGQTNMPLLEANILGCKVICSDFPGHMEQLEDEALYFNPLDPMDIYQKMLEINISKRPVTMKVNQEEDFCNKLNSCLVQIASIRMVFGHNYYQY